LDFTSEKAHAARHKEILPMDEMLDPEMARLRAMRVADLIDGHVGLDRKPFEWEQYKKVLREKMVAAGTAKWASKSQPRSSPASTS
jgi:hypothetical protein